MVPLLVIRATTDRGSRERWISRTNTKMVKEKKSTVGCCFCCSGYGRPESKSRLESLDIMRKPRSRTRSGLRQGDRVIWQLELMGNQEGRRCDSSTLSSKFAISNFCRFSPILSRSFSYRWVIQFFGLSSTAASRGGVLTNGSTVVAADASFGWR